MSLEKIDYDDIWIDITVGYKIKMGHNFFFELPILHFSKLNIKEYIFANIWIFVGIYIWGWISVYRIKRKSGKKRELNRKEN